MAIGTGISLAAGGAVFILALLAPPLAGLDLMLKIGCGAGAALLFIGLWGFGLRRFFFKRFHKKTLQNLDHLTELKNQTRRDTWEAIRNLVLTQLKSTRGKFSLREVRNEYSLVWKAYEKGSKEIREALRELADLSPDEEDEFFKVRLGLTAQATEAGQRPPNAWD